MLTPDDVVHRRFTTTRFGQGYDQDEVDAYLDEITVTLRGHLEGDAAAINLLADDIGGAQFTTTRFRDGYAISEVDDFLDEAAAALRAHEARS
ncbi:DivIVA domain-containing protein [Agrococcus sp. ARC_14]|uniref:DivIVA domain-containing protein n=1 Tax=Agrococcus sp. ARC_14 TaxID=2919927 RepID=UPI003219B6AF